MISQGKLNILQSIIIKANWQPSVPPPPYALPCLSGNLYDVITVDWYDVFRCSLHLKNTLKNIQYFHLSQYHSLQLRLVNERDNVNNSSRYSTTILSPNTHTFPLSTYVHNYILQPIYLLARATIIKVLLPGFDNE